jgi:hypothetical protein
LISQKERDKTVYQAIPQVAIAAYKTPMFTQFRHQYPMGSLTSELLHIHEGKFIVRAIVQVGNATLSTGLSAAHSIEQAEDQARLRALIVLGFEEQSQEAHLISTDVTPQFQSPPDYLALSDSSLPSTMDLGWERNRRNDFPGEQLPPGNNARYSAPPHSLEQLSWLDTPEEWPNQSTGSPKRPTPQPSASTPRQSHSNSGKVSQSAPIDLSDIIAQTDIELKRLGWNHAQGRRHLEKTYRKKSRQHLTDAELLDFLEYLKSQSTSL